MYICCTNIWCCGWEWEKL